MSEKQICPFPHVRTSIVFLSPQMAQELLASNPAHQRKISRANLAKITSDIQYDRWGFTGEPIIKGISGRMLEGQHRCYGVVNTGKGIWVVLVEGVDDESFHLINTGKSRTIADALKIAGEKDTTNLAATLTQLVRYMRSATSVGTNAYVTTSEVMSVLAMQPQVRESMKLCRSKALAQVTAATRVAWLHCVSQDWNKEKSDEFFSKLITGEMLAANDPVYHLRARLIADKASKKRMKTREVMALIIKAWNLFVAGKKTMLLKYADTEAFPELKLP